MGHSSLASKSRQSDLLKHEMVKPISTPRKINTILLNIKINRPQLVGMCGYKQTCQNFTEIFLV